MSASAPRRLTRAGLVSVALVFVLSVATSSVQARDLPEHQIKAALLLNLVAFVNSPVDTFAGRSAPLRFCTLDADRLGRTLKQLIVGETLDGRPMELARTDARQDASACHVLFVGSENATSAFLGALRIRGVLTIGESRAFVQRGGMIGLLRSRNRVRPMVNLDAVEASPLRLSSKLLQLATLIEPGLRD